MGAAGGTSRWIERPRPNTQARLRLICFPYAGGGASLYRQWPELLPATIEVLAIQMPGREWRLNDPAFTRIEPLVAALLEELRPYLTLPFVFFGHSLGALLGYELAHALAEGGLPAPRLLVVSGHWAPHLPDVHPPIHRLPQEAFVAELLKLEGTPPEVLANEELRALILPLLRADFAVSETYRYVARGPLHCPILAFGGVRDRRVSRQQLEEWRAHTAVDFQVRLFRGGHFFLNSERELVVWALAQALQPLLDQPAPMPGM
jgi:medium-chain acyl-[acyl-carrier-protein] hydrolase